MSTTAHNPQSERQDCKTDTCGYAGCETEFPVDVAIHGNYCSVDCYYREKGRKALAQIKSDHKWCATCFRRIKTIMPPDDDAPECAIGQQFQTEHTEWAVDESGGPAIVPIKHQRWGCACGNVNPRNRDELLERVDLGATIRQCFDCLVGCAKTGALDPDPPSARDFEDALQREGVDWEYVIGYTLYAP